MPRNNDHSITQNSWIADLFWLSVCIGIAYFWRLGHYPLFTPDEARYTEIAREMLATGNYITPTLNGVPFLEKPILHYWLQALSIHYFGLNAWAARFFPTLFGIFGCLTTYYSGRLLFNRTTGLCAAIMLASSPLYFISAHYANLDLEIAILITNTLFCFILSTTAISPIKSSAYLYSSVTFSSLAFLSKGLIGIVLPFFICGTWMLIYRYNKPFKMHHIFISSSILLLINIPWYDAVSKANPDFLSIFFIQEHFARFFSTQHFNNIEPIWFYVPLLVLLFFPWIVFFYNACNLASPSCDLKHRRDSSERNRKKSAILLFLMLWTAITLIFFSIPAAKIISYILPLFPAMALLASNQLNTLLNQQKANYSSLMLWHNLLFVLMITLIFFLKTQDWHIPISFKPQLNMIMMILMASMVIASVLIYKKKILALFVSDVISNGLILLILLYHTADFNERSMHGMALKAQPIIHNKDQVFTYANYYYDLPVYLQRQIPIIYDSKNVASLKQDNWQRDLSYSSPHSSSWITIKCLKTQWNRKIRSFIFLNSNDLKYLEKILSPTYVLLKQNNVLLLSNHHG